MITHEQMLKRAGVYLRHEASKYISGYLLESDGKGKVRWVINGKADSSWHDGTRHDWFAVGKRGYERRPHPLGQQPKPSALSTLLLLEKVR